MFGLNSGNCLSVLGFVGAADMMIHFVGLKYFLILNLLQQYSRGGLYGVLNTSFGRIQTEYPEVDQLPNLSFADKRIHLFFHFNYKELSCYEYHQKENPRKKSFKP